MKQLQDLLNKYWDAYSQKPREMQVFHVVPDYTNWLNPVGSALSGFARRVPDADRPHQYEFTPMGMNYKNLAAQEDYMARDITILTGLPDAEGPILQEPQVDHLEKLVASKRAILKNFGVNQVVPGFFTEEDKEYYMNVLNSISTPADALKPLHELLEVWNELPAISILEPRESDSGEWTALKSKSQDECKWVTLDSRTHASEAAIDLKHKGPVVPPICHAGYSEHMRRKAEEKALEASRKMDGEALKAKDAVQEQMLLRKHQGKGYKVLSKQSKEVFDRTVENAYKHRDRPPNAREVEDVCFIIGASKGKSSGNGKREEHMYLVEWEKWKGNPNHLEWLPESHLEGNFDSIDTTLEGKDVTIVWSRLAAGSIRVPYTAVFLECQHLKGDNEGEDILRHVVKYKGDKTIEGIDLRNFAHFPQNGGGFKDEVRVAWILTEHNTETIWEKLQEHESTANTNYGEKRITEARAKGLQNLEERTKKLQAVIRRPKRVNVNKKHEVSSDEDDDVSDELGSEGCDEEDSEKDFDTPWMFRANMQREHDASAKRVVPTGTKRLTRASNRSAHDDDKGNGSDGRKEPKTPKRKADGEALQNRPQTRRKQAEVPPPKKQAPPKRQTKKKKK